MLFIIFANMSTEIGTLLSEFEAYRTSKYKELVQEFQNKLENARDKWKVFERLFGEFEYEYNSKHGSSKEYQYWNRFQTAYENDKTVTLEGFISTAISSEPRPWELFKDLAEYWAIQDYSQFLSKEAKKYREDEVILDSQTLEPKLNWTNLSEIDFVRLVYALIEAGFIEKGKAKKEKTVEAFAKKLDYPLGKSWKSNFSQTNSRKQGYDQLKIFDSLKESFRKYQERKEK